jgi:hypothetical protein
LAVWVSSRQFAADKKRIHYIVDAIDLLPIDGVPLTVVGQQERIIKNFSC